jgi:GNAT superfamily N-acetyltransferase
MTEDVLSRGYHKSPPGCLANVATCLEMMERPAPRHSASDGLSLVPLRGGVDAYHDLYRLVGRDWMWFSRLMMPREKLEAILASPDVEAFVLRKDGQDAGLLELDFREAGQCELAFFGLAPQAIGTHAGRWLMEQAIARAWAKPISRLWVHTCTYDHPKALAFYQRSGFKPYAVLVEVHDDPRLHGLLPREASPQAPLIDP